MRPSREGPEINTGAQGDLEGREGGLATSGGRHWAGWQPCDPGHLVGPGLHHGGDQLTLRGQQNHTILRADRQGKGGARDKAQGTGQAPEWCVLLCGHVSTDRKTRRIYQSSIHPAFFLYTNMSTAIIPR